MLPDKLIVAPAVEPVSLGEAKDYARIQYDRDDQLINELIEGARAWCEVYTGRAFITQTRQMVLSSIPQKREIELTRGPVQNVSAIKVYDKEGGALDFNLKNIIVDKVRVPGRILLQDDAVWPPMQRSANGMVIDYVAGYGDDSSDVPASIRLAIKQLVLHWYENREVIAEGNLKNRVPFTVEVLLQSYRIIKIGAACV